MGERTIRFGGEALRVRVWGFWGEVKKRRERERAEEKEDISVCDKRD